MTDCNDKSLFKLSPTEWDYSQEPEVLPDGLEFLKIFPSADAYSKRLLNFILHYFLLIWNMMQVDAGEEFVVELPCRLRGRFIIRQFRLLGSAGRVLMKLLYNNI